MALTDTTIRNLKPQQKPYKKSDSGGLQLHVMPESSKLWHLAYRLNYSLPTSMQMCPGNL
jgi:hypothetical protein